MEGHFSHLVCLLWSESVDELANYRLKKRLKPVHWLNTMWFFQVGKVEAPISWLWKRPQHVGCTYGDNSNAIIIIMHIMHSAAGCGGWFTPTMLNARCTWVGSHLYHKQICTTVRLQDQLFREVSARLFWSWSKFICCIHTIPSEPYSSGVKTQNAYRMGKEQYIHFSSYSVF